MASNTYTRQTVDGKIHTYSRKEKQGRKPLPVGECKVKLSARVSKWTKEHVKQEARKHNMTPSAYADLALALFDIDNVQLSSDDNCSIQ